MYKHRSHRGGYSSEIGFMTKSHIFLGYPGIEGGFDVEQEQYEDDVKVVILPDRQEVTQEDLVTMPDVVRERVRH